VFVGDAVKWLVLGALGYLAWVTLRNGIHANVGPGELSNGYPFGATKGFGAAGFVPIGSNGGGLSFSGNVPWDIQNF
jgi:hypothetical protein